MTKAETRIPISDIILDEEIYPRGGVNQKRVGDDWPGRIPAQLIAHVLYYFSSQNDLVFDPMGGGGVTPDVCLTLNRRCWTMDMIDRLDTRPEIEPYCWDIKSDFKKGQKASGLFNSKQKPDLIIMDPPYFDKKRDDYGQKSISMLPRQEYLEFFECFLALMKQHTKNTTKLAFINADWRDFQNKSAVDEDSLGFQYIVTMNEDALPAELPKDFDLEQYIMPTRLTDASEDGGFVRYSIRIRARVLVKMDHTNPLILQNSHSIPVFIEA